jgi:hypothetical protein
MRLGPDAEVPKVTVSEMWTVIDKWWLPKDEQLLREYADVDWNGRRFVFAREAPDTTWRIKDAASAL